MAASYSCDGCGKQVKDPVKLGHVIRRDYCEDCAKLVKEFLDRETTLISAVVKTYINERAELIKKFSRIGKLTIQLPDVIDDDYPESNDSSDIAEIKAKDVSRET